MTTRRDQRVARGPGPDAFRGASRVERALLPFLREPTLWPVLAVLLAHVMLLVSPMLVFVWREGHGWSLFGLAVLGAASAAAVVLECRSRGGPRLLSALVAGTWAICAAGAWTAAAFDWL